MKFTNKIALAAVSAAFAGSAFAGVRGDRAFLVTGFFGADAGQDRPAELLGFVGADGGEGAACKGRRDCSQRDFVCEFRSDRPCI